jgi:hypothetical protein
VNEGEVAPKFDSLEWSNWLKFISDFFSCYSVSSIHNSDCNYSRPHVAVELRDKALVGLLDTGCAVSLLGNGAHNYFTDSGSILQQGKPLQLTAAGGQTLTSIGFLYLPVTFQDQTHILEVHVVPEIQNSLILGMDFWNSFGLFPKNLASVIMRSETEVALADLVVRQDVNVCGYDHLTKDQRVTTDHIISQFHDISYEKRGLGRTSLITHSIDTGDAAPIRQRYYRMSLEKQQILIEQLDEMLKEGVVEPCESAWSSPVLLTPKKNGQLRFCLDSRKLNAVTKKDAYSLPYISEILDNLRDAKYLTSLDLSKSFWQILIRDEDRCKTSFYIPTRGTFCFKSMPFGLTNAPATQQRLVDQLFYGPEFEHKVFVYIDDIIIVSPTFEEHISLLVRVRDKLKTANLTINFEKSQFFRKQLKYLGYVVDSNGLHADPEKVEAIVSYPTPKNRKEVRRFLGTASWYRRFIPNFSSLASPLNKLTSQAKTAPPFSWSIEADMAFKSLKKCLISTPVLACPDYSKHFEVSTDASDVGIGAVLTQTIDGTEKVIAYMSKSLSKQEQNYSAMEREALALLTAVEHWRCYLENGKQFIVYTDHAALKWFMHINNPTGRLARWGVRLSTFNCEIRHRRGRDNVVPDSLSRIPISLLNQSTPLPNNNNITDAWYLNIFNGCQNNPTAFPDYQVINNKLYRFKRSLNPLTREFEWKEVIPLDYRQQILEQNHSCTTAGHFGVLKTYKRLSLKYFWVDMHRDVTIFVGNCEVCKSYKHANHATLGTMGRPKECCRPFQMISMDLVGPLPSSRKQNTFLLVVTCCFSKYCLLFPIRRATAEIISHILEDQVFLVHGIPKTVLMDNGKQFVSNTLKVLFAKYRIPDVRYTPKYSPQINLVERYNKSTITAISSFIENDDHRSWDTNVSKIQFAINSSTNEVTGFTPSFLVHGRELITCGSHYLDVDRVNDIIFSPRDEYAENLGALRKVFDQVQCSLFKAHSRNCTYYNLRRKQAEFNVGDYVWKRTYYQSDKDSSFAKKLAPKYVKCLVIAKKSPLVYVLQNMQGNNIGDWHIKDFKLTNYNI